MGEHPGLRLPARLFLASAGAKTLEERQLLLELQIQPDPGSVRPGAAPSSKVRNRARNTPLTR
jgi:hypothetical protein